MEGKLKIVDKTNSYTPVSVNEKNEALFQELRSRGLYVQKIGWENDTKYLVVSCEEPPVQIGNMCNL